MNTEVSSPACTDCHTGESRLYNLIVFFSRILSPPSPLNIASLPSCSAARVLFHSFSVGMSPIKFTKSNGITPNDHKLSPFHSTHKPWTSPSWCHHRPLFTPLPSINQSPCAGQWKSWSASACWHQALSRVYKRLPATNASSSPPHHRPVRRCRSNHLRGRASPLLIEQHLRSRSLIASFHVMNARSTGSRQDSSLPAGCHRIVKAQVALHCLVASLASLPEFIFIVISSILDNHYCSLVVFLPPSQLLLFRPPRSTY
jgi:hypothetical protein